ncbi:MAG TPA: hypothetical protein VD908_13870 [Cytophagales bacterium]|nr:hypothetical protein [Cytophagales bacterium]
MDGKMEDIIIKLTHLHKKQYLIESEIKKHLTEPFTMEKFNCRIRNESKLKELRKEIEQEEYNLEEARILESLETR